MQRDAQAVKQLSKLAGNADPAIAAAAIGALGKIGGKSAAAYLRKLEPAEDLKPVRMIALVDCARSLEGSGAVALYEIVLASQAPQRVAALSGMLAVDEPKAVALMVAALKGNDAELTRGVLTLVAGEKSARLTKAMTELLGALPDEKEVALITVLGARGDTAALGAITWCLASTNDQVRAAAAQAAAKLGNEGTVTLTGGAAEVIAVMPGSGVNDTLIKALNDDKLRLPAVRALVARNCTAAVPGLFKLLNDPDPGVRRAAWSGLGSLASEQDMVPLVKAAFVIKDEGELTWGAAAARNVCAHAPDKAKCFEVIAARYDGTTDAVKSIIIELAPLIYSPAAMEVVKKALKSENKDLYGKAVRSLTAWENGAGGAPEELIELAQKAPEESERIVAVRGYIRLAGEGPNLSEQQRAEMFKKAAELATRVEEKKLIAGTLRTVPNAVTLVIANTYLDDSAVSEDAEPSALDIAEHLHAEKRGPPDVIKEVANKLLTSKNAGFVDRAKRIQAEMGK